MKKNFFKKKLASGLALALVVASLSPAGVSAATATKIVKQDKSKAPTVLYVGDKGTDYTLSSTSKANTYSWKISNSKLATINAKTGVVTAKAPGTVTVKVTARNAKTNKWLKDFTLKLYIKQRAKTVDIGAEDFTLGAGETKDLNAVKSPKTSTDVVVYASSDVKVATVNAKTGLVKAVAPGEATITVYSKGLSSSAITSKYNRTDSVKVKVAFGVSKVEQAKADQLVLTFNDDAKDVKASDIAIVNDTTKQTYAVKSVSADGKTLTVDTFQGMVDGKVYTLTYGGKDIQFTATDNVVTSLAFSTVTVPFETATKVTVSTKDAKGVVLGTYGLDETEAKLDFTIETSKGYTTGDKLVLFAIGDTAKASAVWHTYKYDEVGQEIGAIKAEVTITAVDKTNVTISNTKYTIAKTAPDWAKYTKNVNLAINDDAATRLWFYAEKSDKTAVTAGDYTFESSNKDILLVDTVGGTLSAYVTAVAQGTAYVLVKDTDGKVVWSLPVTIVAERKATSLVLGTTSVSLSNSPDATVVDSKDVTVTLKDQYSTDLPATSVEIGDITVAALSTSVSGLALTSITEANNYFTVANGKVTFKGANIAAGTYVYKITVADITRTVTVTVKAPVAAATEYYQLIVSDKSVDTKFDTSVTSKNIIIKVAVTKGGVVDRYVSFTGVAGGVDTTADNVVIKKGSDVVTGSAINGTELTFEALSVAGNVVSKAAVGSYSVAVTVPALNGGTGNVTLTDGFAISDSQAGLSVAKKTDTVTGGANTAAAVAQAFKFVYDGTTLDFNATTSTTADDAVIASYTYTLLGNTVHVKTVTVNVPVGSYLVPITVTVGSSFTY